MHCIIKGFLLDYDSFTFPSLPHVTVKPSGFATLGYYSKRKLGNGAAVGVTIMRNRKTWVPSPLYSVALHLLVTQYPVGATNTNAYRVWTDNGNDHEEDLEGVLEKSKPPCLEGQWPLSSRSLLTCYNVGSRISRKKKNLISQQRLEVQSFIEKLSFFKCGKYFKTL